MSLLPSPFPSSAPQATPRTAQAPLATLYDAPPASPRHASTSALASPSRAMMDDEDAQNRADDDLPASSPRRLIDAFLHASSPAKARRNASLLPPKSPRRTALPQRDEEQAMPTWSFYEDTPDASLAPAPVSAPSPPSTLSDPASPSADDSPHKENSRPPPRPRLRSASTAPPAPPPPVLPTTAPHSPPRTPPAATSAAAAFFSPSPSLALAISTSGGGTTASSFFAESGPTSFASAAIGGAGGFGGLLPALETAAADVREARAGKKRESLEEPGVGGAKRARRDVEDEAPE